MADAFDNIIVRDETIAFFRTCLQTGRLSHAYLFVGSPRSGALDAAYALAKSLLCATGGCGTQAPCETCRRIENRKHPDVLSVSPQGVKTYLAEQIRDIVYSVERAPLQAGQKVYILEHVEQMNAAAANAFLKTLEEPPARVTFILLATSVEGVLPTIVSRTQVIRFADVELTRVVRLLAERTGQDSALCAGALAACNGSINEAEAFCASPERVAFRRRVFEIMSGLQHANQARILDFARELEERMKEPAEALRLRLEAQAAADAEFLGKEGKGLAKVDEARIKRAVSAQTTAVFLQTTALMASWLRDVLLLRIGVGEGDGAGDAATAEGALFAHVPQDYEQGQSAALGITNGDFYDELYSASVIVDEKGIVDALAACRHAEQLNAYNITLQNNLDVLLFALRRALYAR